MRSEKEIRDEIDVLKSRLQTLKDPAYMLEAKYAILSTLHWVLGKGKNTITEWEKSRESRPSWRKYS